MRYSDLFSLSFTILKHEVISAHFKRFLPFVLGKLFNSSSILSLAKAWASLKSFKSYSGTKLFKSGSLLLSTWGLTSSIGSCLNLLLRSLILAKYCFWSWLQGRGDFLKQSSAFLRVSSRFLRSISSFLLWAI